MACESGLRSLNAGDWRFCPSKLADLSQGNAGILDKIQAG